MSELSEELLVAYVDGQLARAQSVAVKRVIDFDEVANARVGKLRSANKRLEEAFEAMLRERPAEDASETPGEESEQAAETSREASSARSAPSALAVLLGNHGALVVGAGALALLLLGGGVGYLITNGGIARAVPPPPAPPRLVVPDWQKEIARTQALYGREALEVSLESQANRELVRFQLANAIGPAVVVPDLETLGLTFVRAQLLRRAGVPIAQISYLPAQGQPIALYAQAQRDGEPLQVTDHAEAGIRTHAWRHEGIVYVIAAGLPPDQLAKLAGAVKQRIAAP